jgi:hypothetical protein
MAQRLTVLSHGPVARLTALVCLVCVSVCYACVGSLSACVCSLSLAASVRHASVRLGYAALTAAVRSQAPASGRLCARVCLHSFQTSCAEHNKLAMAQQKKLAKPPGEKVGLALRRKWPEAHERKVGFSAESP